MGNRRHQRASGQGGRRLAAIVTVTTLTACDGIYAVHGLVHGAPCDSGAALPVEGARVGAVRSGKVLYGTRTNQHGVFRLAVPSGPLRDKVPGELEVAKEGCKTEKMLVDFLPANVEGPELEVVLDCTCPVPAS